MFPYYYWPALGFIMGTSTLGHKYHPETVDDKVFFVDYISAAICILLISLVGAHALWKRYNGEIDRESEDGFVASYVTTESIKFLATRYLQNQRPMIAEYAVLALSVAYSIFHTHIPDEYALIHWTVMAYCAYNVIQQGYMAIFWSLKQTVHSKIMLGLFRILRYTITFPVLIVIRYDYVYPSDIPNKVVLGWLGVLAIYLDISTHGVGTHGTVLPKAYRPAPPQFSLLPAEASNPFEAENPIDALAAIANLPTHPEEKKKQEEEKKAPTADLLLFD